MLRHVAIFSCIVTAPCASRAFPSRVSIGSSHVKAKSTDGTCPAALATHADRGGRDGVTVPVSRIGFGTYRVGDVQEHRDALRDALRQGINLIDTSANYGDGAAEEVIGDVLEEMTAAGEINRRDILLVSKFGYIQGQNLDRYMSKEVVTPETVHYGQGIKHCIHPDFMRDQLQRSLARLRQQELDVYLLHNPEYYLTDALRDESGSYSEAQVEERRQEMLRRIYQAFVALETEAQQTGRIRSYGISSNSFSLPHTHPHFLPYAGLLDMAAKAAAEVSGEDTGKHHLSTLQMPGNLLEREGLTHAAKWAKDNGLAVLINRPLNAFNDRGSYRLADAREKTHEYRAAMDEALTYAEQRGFSVMGDVVRGIDAELKGVSVCVWEGYVHRRALPLLRRAIDVAGRDERCVELAQAFLDQCAERVRSHSADAARSAVKAEGFDVPPVQTQKLQDYALEQLLKDEAVTCVLLGCRSPEYVEDAVRMHRKYPPVRNMPFV